MSTAQETTLEVVPAYIPWETFTGFLGHLKATAVPSRIDKSVMPSDMPSLTRGQIQSALKFLRLVHDNGTTTKELKDLVYAYDTDQWGSAVSETIAFSDSYTDIVGELDIDNATQSQLDERFKAAGVTGQMLLKSVRFYLQALTAAGCKFSPHFLAKRKSNGGSKRTPRAKSAAEKTSSVATAKNADGHEKSSTTETTPPGCNRYPLYFKGKPDGTIIVPADLTATDCAVIELQFKVLKAYAGIAE